jgi:hypothetical protein
MKQFLQISLLSIFVLISLGLNAQVTIKGKTLDRKTGQTLPFCTIYFEGKRIGTKSDSYGNFSISSPNNETKLFASYLGYKTEVINIDGSKEGLVIRMGEQPRTTKRQTIIQGTRKLAKDTLAVRIIRSAIRNKDNNKPSSFKSIQFDKYTKFEVDLANIDSIQGSNFIAKPLKYILEYQNQTPDGEKYSPILFRETFAKEYLKSGKRKVQIHGVKDTKIFDNESIYSLLNYAFDNYSVYDNQIIIANKSFTSPLADLALLFYRYYVDDSARIDGKMNYYMSFAPVSKEDFGFTGKLTIEEGSWAVKEVSLGIDKRANINWVNHLALTSEYELHENKWLLKKEEKDIALSISKSKKATYKLRFRQSEIVNNVKVNQYISDSLFFGEETDYLSNYKRVDENFLKANRVEELTDFERGIYERADSFKRTHQYQTLKYFTRVATSAFFPIPPINMEVGRAYQFISWNKFEGTRLRFGARTMFDQFKNMNLSMYLAYGTLDEQFKYGGEFYYNFPKKNRRWNQLYFAAIHDYQRLGESENLLFFDNTIQSIFRKKDNRISDIILKDEVKLMWTKEWQRGSQTQLGFNRTRFYANETYPFVENLNDGTQLKREYIGSTRFTASYRYAPKEPVFENEFNRVRLRSIRPVITFSSTIGVKGLWDSDYSFMRLKTEMKQVVPLFIGQFRYNVQAGATLGTVPYIDLEQHGGNQSYIKDEFRYMLMNEGEFTSDAFAQVWLYHNFNGFFLNKIPLLKKLGWREFVFGKALRGSINQRNLNYIVVPQQMSAPGDLYSEAGFGINNIFKFLEVNMVWRLTQLEKTTSRPFGVLFGFNLDM